MKRLTAVQRIKHFQRAAKEDRVCKENFKLFPKSFADKYNFFPDLNCSESGKAEYCVLGALAPDFIVKEEPECPWNQTDPTMEDFSWMKDLNLPKWTKDAFIYLLDNQNEEDSKVFAKRLANTANGWRFLSPKQWRGLRELYNNCVNEPSLTRRTLSDTFLEELEKKIARTLKMCSPS